MEKVDVFSSRTQSYCRFGKNKGKNDHQNQFNDYIYTENNKENAQFWYNAGWRDALWAKKGLKCIAGEWLCTEARRNGKDNIVQSG